MITTRQTHAPGEQHFSQWEDRRFQPFLSTETIPKMTRHDGSLSPFVTIFNARWQRVTNAEEISSHCHQRLEKERKTLATETTNLSYCQWEHISTQVDDTSAVTAIKPISSSKKSTACCSVIIIPTQKCTHNMQKEYFGPQARRQFTH